MRVFVMGGTGSIGTALTAELVARGHEVTVLSRSAVSDTRIAQLGGVPLRGDLRAPQVWAEEAAAQDAVIQAAATFDEDMGNVDRAVVQAIMEAAQGRARDLRMIYTGGCWLYGETGDAIATEEMPFDPLPAFAWMVAHADRLLNAPGLSTAIVHPAMVYHQDGGVFSRFLEAVRLGQAPEIWGDATTRWPLIDRRDLARAYCALLDRPDLTGHFNAASEDGVRVGEIADWLRHLYGIEPACVERSVSDVVAEHGAWAMGPTLDQRMSSAKLQRLTGWRPEITDHTVLSFTQSRALD